MSRKKPIAELYDLLTESIDCETKAHKKFLDELIDADDQIRNLLKSDDPLLVLYTKSMDYLEGVYFEEIACYYTAAFRFGVLLGLDVAEYHKEKDK